MFKYGLLFIFVIACKQRTEDKSFQFQIIRYENGKPKSEIHYINDTIMHGPAKYYYSNGNVAEEMNYVNGLLDGRDTKYYENGEIYSIIKYKKGLRDGKSYQYFQNGRIKTMGNWYNDSTFGDVFYYEEGILETFSSFDFEGHCRYLIKYDVNGIKIREEGTVLGQFMLESFDSVRANQPIGAQICVTTPPNRVISVYSGELRGAKLINVDTLTVVNNIATYNPVFTELGKHILITVGKMEDLQGNLLKSDSIVTEITVLK